MAWDEAKAWLSGTLNGNLYQNLLDDALTRPARNARRKKIIHPEDMPWEMARRGRVPLRGRGSRLRPASGLQRRDQRHLPLAAAGRDQALRVGGGRRHLHPPVHDSFSTSTRMRRARRG